MVANQGVRITLTGKIIPSAFLIPNVPPSLRRCRVCGCTDMNACWDPKVNHPCYWVEDDLCSACVDEQQL